MKDEHNFRFEEFQIGIYCCFTVLAVCFSCAEEVKNDDNYMCQLCSQGKRIQAVKFGESYLINAKARLGLD